MITSIKHKGLKELLDTGRSKHVRPDLISRVLRRLDALHRATSLRDLNAPGFGFHALKGTTRYAIAVNGPRRITFGWDGRNVTEVDLEQYH